MLPTHSLASAAKYSSIHSIAIVSHIGNEFSFERSGMTIFDNHLDHASLDGWALDQRFVDSLTKILSSRYVIKSEPASSFSLDGCDSPSDCAKLLPRSADFDAYVVVYGSTSRGFGAPGQEFNGVGLFYIHGFIRSAHTALHVIYGIAVIDAKTGSVIDWTGGQLSKSYFGDHPPPVMDADGSLWPETVPNLTTQQIDAIKASISQLLDDSIPSTVDALGLLQ